MTTRGRIMFLILLGLISLFGLFDHSLWSANDTREGAMISEMVRTRCWVAPVFNGQHYLEKPPLLHWTGAILCRLFGTVSEGLVRLPAALYAFGALLVMLSWARELGREQAGFAAAFMCATSILFFEYARIVLTDSALTFMVVFSLWLFWRARMAAEKIVWKYTLFLVAAAFSFYAKGLLGPGMIWLAVLAWLIYQKRFKLAVVLSLAFAVIFVFILAPWVYALWKTGGSAYLHKVFWENQFGRFLYFDDPSLPIDPYLVHKEPVYFYLIMVLPFRLLPWTLLVVPALYYWFRRAGPMKGDLELFLKVSLVAIAFLLHISSAKAACYALPMVPFIFLMTGIWLEDAAAAWGAASARSAAHFSALDQRLITITFMLSGMAIILAPLGYMAAMFSGLDSIWAPGNTAAFTALGIALVALLAGWVLLRSVWMAFDSGRVKAALLIMPIVVAVAGVVGTAAYIPTVDYHRSYVPFARLALAELNSGRRLAFEEDSERDLGAFMFYLNTRIETVSPADRDSLSGFISGGKDLPSPAEAGFAKAGPAGIIVPVGNLMKTLRQLKGWPVKVKQVENCGKKSASFRLVTVGPAKESPPPTRPKSGKPKRAGK